MRTTVDLDDELLRAANRRPAERGCTLAAFIEDALAAALIDKPGGKSNFRLRWTPHRGRLRRGIELSRRAPLLDAMEDGD